MNIIFIFTKHLFQCWVSCFLQVKYQLFLVYFCKEKSFFSSKYQAIIFHFRKAPSVFSWFSRLNITGSFSPSQNYFSLLKNRWQLLLVSPSWFEMINFSVNIFLCLFFGWELEGIRWTLCHSIVFPWNHRGTTTFSNKTFGPLH